MAAIFMASFLPKADAEARPDWDDTYIRPNNASARRLLDASSLLSFPVSRPVGKLIGQLEC